MILDLVQARKHRHDKCLLWYCQLMTGLQAFGGVNMPQLVISKEVRYTLQLPSRPGECSHQFFRHLIGVCHDRTRKRVRHIAGISKAPWWVGIGPSLAGDQALYARDCGDCCHCGIGVDIV